MIQDGNGLYDMLIVSRNTELHLCAAVGMTQTKLSPLYISILQLLEQFLTMEADSTIKSQLLLEVSSVARAPMSLPKKISCDFRGFCSLEYDVRESRLDAVGQVLVGHTQHDFAFLCGLRYVGIEYGL
jgi:hypothetical protein